MFKCVFVPEDELKPVQELSLSKDGGLEKDALRLLAEETFSSDLDSTLDTAAQHEATVAELVKGGMDSDRVAEVMAQLAKGGGGKAPRLGSSVEIVCVGLATPDNGHCGVSLYCDGNARFKSSLKINKRATKLVQAAGQGERIVYGDVYLGRAHDDESQEWQRLDFTIRDSTTDSLWVGEAARVASGKNMAAYTTSGALESYSSQFGTNSSGASTVFSSATGSAVGFAANWNQSNEEVEVRYFLPPGVSSKMINVTISRKTLYVGLKGGDSTEKIEGVPEKVQIAGGAALYDEVVAGDSTWSLDGRELVITMQKAKSKKWIDVYDA